jgi:hypothetical protein
MKNNGRRISCMRRRKEIEKELRDGETKDIVPR